ncbi:MAG: hypothetical protein R2827_03770 [Bdellovibrionales bacterium]
MDRCEWRKSTQADGEAYYLDSGVKEDGTVAIGESPRRMARSQDSPAQLVIADLAVVPNTEKYEMRELLYNASLLGIQDAVFGADARD